jgi:pimeloyl-ACP methyl ester carboxylesterase
MKVIFSHGKESGPWGSKITLLAKIARQHGCRVDSIDYRNIGNPDDRVTHLIEALTSEEKIILVGSSMGGYVSLVTAEQAAVQALFLLAPALYIPGYGNQEYIARNQPTEIVHGWSDDIIPPENSIRFAREANCSLHLIPGDHRLNSSIGAVSVLFNQFLHTTVEDLNRAG